VCVYVKFQVTMMMYRLHILYRKKKNKNLSLEFNSWQQKRKHNNLIDFTCRTVYMQFSSVCITRCQMKVLSRAVTLKTHHRKINSKNAPRRDAPSIQGFNDISYTLKHTHIFLIYSHSSERERALIQCFYIKFHWAPSFNDNVLKFKIMSDTQMDYNIEFYGENFLKTEEEKKNLCFCRGDIEPYKKSTIK
jgi:hypothetical protein